MFEPNRIVIDPFRLAQKRYRRRTYRYPTTQQKSAHQPSRSQHTAVSCSWPYQREPTCAAPIVSQCLHFPIPIIPSVYMSPNPSLIARKDVVAYWTISGRIGAVNTAGRGCVAPEGLPSAVAMETVGREAIVSVVNWSTSTVGVVVEGEKVVVGRRRRNFTPGPAREVRARRGLGVFSFRFVVGLRTRLG